MSTEQPKSDRILLIIAIYKIVQALLFFAAAVGVLHLLHKDTEAWLQSALDHSHVDPKSHLVRSLLRHAGGLTNTKLETISAVCFFYGCLFGTEGVGLYLKQRWAEYLVVIITASLLPLEIYELWKSITVAKALLITGNLAILGYLVYVIWVGKKAGK